MSSEWLRSNKASRCPVCEGDSWCTFTGDGSVVKCMRVKSEQPHKKGGWLHFDKPLDMDRIPKESKPAPKVDAEPIAKQMYQDELAPLVRNELSESLGVTTASLDLLRVGVGWDDHDGTRFASFPSRDANGKVVGITRRYRDGSKKTFRGTSNGIFYTPNWHERKGVILIVEGASDVAAAESVGLCAIGRSSNIGGVPEIKAMLDRQVKADAYARPVVVIGENDEKPHKRGVHDYCPTDCPGCTHCFPGKFGAEYVAEQLNCGYCMPPSPLKDLRQCVASGTLWLDLIQCIH